MAGPPRLFDRALHRRRLDSRRAGVTRADFLKRRAAERHRRAPGGDHAASFPVAVDLGARDGAFARALAASDAAGKVGLLVETDLSAAMLAGRPASRLVADEERLPFAPASLDLVVSRLALHWTNDLVGALIQIRRALKPDGLFIGAILGGATLTELRAALTEAELELSGGAGPRVSPFADAYDAAGLLQRAGFALPVADVDRVTRALRPRIGADGRPAGDGRDQRAGRRRRAPADPRAASPAPPSSTPSGSREPTDASPPPSRSSP